MGCHWEWNGLCEKTVGYFILDSIELSISEEEMELVSQLPDPVHNRVRIRLRQKQ